MYTGLYHMLMTECCCRDRLTCVHLHGLDRLTCQAPESRGELGHNCYIHSFGLLQREGTKVNSCLY